MNSLKTVLIVITLIFCSGQTDAASISLARDYPEALAVRAMAQRAVLDFRVERGSFPQSLRELEDGGYCAYLFPTDFRPTLEHAQDSLEINCLGRPAFAAGESASLRHEFVVRTPTPGLYTTRQDFGPDGDSQTVQAWHFPGAEWVAAGHSSAAIQSAMRFDRIYAHTCWLLADYKGSFGSMPGGLQDIEQYFGTERNPYCWQGVIAVSSPEQVEFAAGSFFAGWHNNYWVVSMNTGLGVKTTRWASKHGNYIASRGAITY
jgi:hypothetical protein